MADNGREPRLLNDVPQRPRDWAGRCATRWIAIISAALAAAAPPAPLPPPITPNLNRPSIDPVPLTGLLLLVCRRCPTVATDRLPTQVGRHPAG